VKFCVPLRREESKYTIEQVHITVEFYGGGICKDIFCYLSIVKKYVKHAQLSENFILDHATLKSNCFFHSFQMGMMLEPYSIIFVLYRLIFRYLNRLWSVPKIRISKH